MPEAKLLDVNTHTHELIGGVAGADPILYTHTHKYSDPVNPADAGHTHARYIGPPDTFVEPGAHRFASTSHLDILSHSYPTTDEHSDSGIGIPE